MSEKTISTPASGAKGDDRNLVPAEAGSLLSVEDRFFEYCRKNRGLLIGIAVAAVVAVAAVQVVRLVRAGQQAEISAAYGAATTIEQKRSFARANPGHELAGLALLAVADDSYANQRFEDAAREYASAAKELTEPVLRDRARIGEGVALIKAGQAATGEERLRAVASDTNALMAHRTQAYYEIASFAAGAGDRAKARETIDQLKALGPESIWANFADQLRSRLDTEELKESASGAGFSIPSASGTP